MQLTDDQKAAAAAFTAFMVSDDKEMVISGAAGVGKSTLLRYLMEDSSHERVCELLDVRPITRWVLTATTNKAAEVLQGSTNEETTTVHSRLGIQVRQDFKTGKEFLSRKPNSPILEDSLLVVDEASMIDRDLDRFIRESTLNCKLLFVGDHCQMAPVGESLSPVFARNTPVQLNQVVRSQHTPAITALCQQLRETVETGIFKPIQAVPGIIDYLSPEEVQQELHDFFVRDARLDGRILCFRNEQVNGFNAWLREQRGLPPGLLPGDQLISNSSTIIQGADYRLRIEQELSVIEVGDVQQFKVGPDVFLPVRMVVTTEGEVLVADDPAQHKQYMKHFAGLKNWEAYFRLKEQIADLRPRDACTVYKSQGSTYHTVFVDLKDIGRCTIASQAARMLYVACSRPTHRIRFIGSLPPRLQGG